RWVHQAGTNPIASYTVYRATFTANGQLPALVAPLTTLAVPPATQTTSLYLDTTPANGLWYYYQVKITDTAGKTAVTNEDWARATVPPSAPRNLTAVPGSRFAVLAWDAPLSGGDLGVS